jgi:hypothetical protein
LRDPQLRHYDGLALALRALDTVIDRMGLENEATGETIARQLDPILSAMDEVAGVEPSRRLHDLMIERLLSGLRNDGDARRPFREEYAAVDPGGTVSRRFVEFRLLYDSHHPDGRIVLRVTNEAANLYLRFLDMDIEDAQAATEAVVQSQLERGRFDEAVLSARQARVQSIRFQQKVSAILSDTRRDVDRVDWQEESREVTIGTNSVALLASKPILSCGMSPSECAGKENRISLKGVPVPKCHSIGRSSLLSFEPAVDRPACC